MTNTFLTVNGFKINAYLVTLISRLSNNFYKSSVTARVA